MFTQGRVRVIALWLADVACILSVWAAVVVLYWKLGRWLAPQSEVGAWVAGLGLNLRGYDPSSYLAFWPVAVIFVFFNMVLDLYHGNWMYPSAPLQPVEEMRRLFASSLMTHLGLVALVALRSQDLNGVLSRVVVTASGVLTALLAQSFRNWMRALLHRLGLGQIPVVLAGGGEVAARVAAVLKDDPYAGLRIVGYFAGASRQGRCRRRAHWRDAELAARGIRYMGSLRDIVPEARRRDIKILLACQDERLFRQQLDEFTKWFTYIEYLPTARSFPIYGSKAVSFDGVGGLEMVNQGRMRVKRVQKRLTDTLLAGLVFVCVSPLFAVIPVLIKLTSRGGVFYRQTRLGKGGRPFRIWKFRSMYADADARLERLLASNPRARREWERSFKLARDPRVTPLGWLLRKTSLDELPQLFNVLAGDMALIGPRPIVAAEVRYYGDAYSIFSSVKPGVTGLWQVSGRSDTDYTRRVALDTHYVLNWSPWMDIWIFLRTICAVLLMRGAR